MEFGYVVQWPLGVLKLFHWVSEKVGIFVNGLFIKSEPKLEYGVFIKPKKLQFQLYEQAIYNFN
jgi:hypothetical protein